MTDENPWAGEWGTRYQERNATRDMDARLRLWRKILSTLNNRPRSVLEVGAGTGSNLIAIREACIGLHGCAPNRLLGVDPNSTACAIMHHRGIDHIQGEVLDLEIAGTFSLVVTSGFLIHVGPDELEQTVKKIGGWAHLDEVPRIASVEYFAAEPELVERYEVPLWRRDYGSVWESVTGRTVDQYGFMWKPRTGLDNVTWWTLR